MGSSNIYPIFYQLLTRKEREEFLGQKSCVFWLTGLSGSGKSTIARVLERLFFQQGLFCQVLDGDNIRSGINSDLTFSAEDRLENIRRIAEIAKLYKESGLITICSFISPMRKMRDLAREIIGPVDFHEVHISTPLAICEQRDVKGLYKMARDGKIQGFTGIDSPFELPEHPEIIIETEGESPTDSATRIYTFYQQKIAH